MSKGSDVCKTALREQFGAKDGKDGVLSDKAINSLVDRLEKFKDTHLANGGTGESFKRIAIQMIEQDRRNLLANKIEANSNLIKKKQRYNDYAGYKGDLSGAKAGRAMGDAILGKLSGSNRLKKGANASAFRYQKARVIEYKANLYHSMQQRGVFDAFRDGDMAMQTDIAREIWHIGEGGKGMKTTNSVAYEIAQVVHAHNQKMLSDIRLAGQQIGEIPTYIMPQTHNRELLKEMGKEKWIEKIGPEIDQVKTFGADAGDGEKMTDFLSHAYDNIVDGNFEQIDDIIQSADELITTAKYGKLGAKISQSRSLHFKDADSFMRYNGELGQHDLFTGIVKNTESMAKAGGLIEVFGTNPDAAVQADIANVRKALKGDDKALSAFNGTVSGIESTFKIVRGTSNVPANDIFAKTMGGVRALTSMAKLGFAAVRGLTDLANAAAVLSATTGKPYLSTQLDILSESLKAISPKYRNDMTALMGAHFKDYLLNIHGRTGMDPDQAPGMITKAMSYYFRMNGQEFMTDIARSATAKTMSNYTAGIAHKTWAELGDDLLQFKSNMERYDINEEMWDHIRQGVHDLDDGSKAVIPDGIADRKSQQAYRNMINDLAELGSPEPTARAKARLLHGTQPGTMLGEFLRTVTQFKAFPVFMYDVASRVSMSNPNRPINEMRELMKGRGDFKNLAGFMLGTTALAYTADSLIEMSQNRTPKNPMDPKIVAEMFARGGAGGMYADLLVSESMKTKPDWIKSLAGPTAGTLTDVVGTGVDFLKGRDVGLKAFNTAVSAVPYNNVFGMKTVLDYTLLDGMRNSIDPSYERTKQKRLRDNDRGELF